MSEIKAIQTNYNGILYRSRIEARWAIFLDNLQIPFEYEKEGFELPSGKYLPDFWLPNQEYWIEIKGAPPNESECQKAAELSVLTHKKVFILFGGIPVNNTDKYNESAYSYYCGVGDSGYWFCECSSCKSIGIEFNGRRA
jgi:hypothetical protein